MKVLHVNAGLETGGGLTHIINLLKEAKKEQEDFTLLCLAAGPVADAARAAGLRVQVLGITSRYALSSLRQLSDFINQNGYEIVHSHGARANLFLALIKRKLRAQWCVTVHSDPYLDFEGRGLAGRAFTFANLRALRRADCVFAVTKRFANLVTDKVGVMPKKVHVIYNGTFFHENSEIRAKIAHPGFNLVNVARAEKIKGQELLLQALKKLDYASVHLYIAGDGPQLPHLKDLVQQLGLGPQVSFQGFLTQPQLTDLYRQMDLAVLTSYSESFPLVLLEASDHLLPLLATTVGDIEMMIPDSEHGFVTPVGDVGELTATLKSALNRPTADLKKMAAREKDYVAHHFSLQQQLTSIVRVYQELLAG
ncbi:glycosyltransferase [Lactobacillus xylocopicola]|uniref:Galactosyltransferase n=1 Tax=Lactobacillus xylocopicola TaxID=2976676 RepID=A0ABN6SK99_9LACO|nr:glycosyltransferase [Lactobacillus xylocopicola]BDR60078.1 galactosyltransferase [Lactobacillus xylocopicola]